MYKMSGLLESNRRPFDNYILLQSNALPTELKPEIEIKYFYSVIYISI